VLARPSLKPAPWTRKPAITWWIACNTAGAAAAERPTKCAAEWQRKHPLTHRDGRERVINQMGGGFRHAPHADRRGKSGARLHENATSFSLAHSLQRSRRNPCARMPLARKASNSASTHLQGTAGSNL
jgi:hypothetical protein